MRNPVRVAIVVPALCLDCPHNAKPVVIIGTNIHWADCRRALCDNHREGPLEPPPRTSDTPPLELPQPGSTHPLE